MKLFNPEDYKKPEYAMSIDDILTKNTDGTFLRLKSYNGESWYVKTWAGDLEEEPDDWTAIVDRNLK